MRKALRVGVVAVLGVLVLGLLGVQVLRWTALDEHDEQLLALARVPPPPAQGQGRSGFAALALSGYEIPADAIDAEMAAEVQAFTDWVAAEGNEAGGLGRWTPIVAGRYAARPQIAIESRLCRLAVPDCLAMLHADTGPIRAFMAGETARLALVDRALSADHVHSPYPPSHQAPLPPLATLRLSLTQAAIDAVDGRVPQALSRTCRTLAAARRFTPGARDLFSQLFFPALAEGSAALLLDIRREHPSEPLPDDCRDALEPVQPEDFLICEAMRGEFRMGAALSASQAAALARQWTPRSLFARWLLMDSELHDAWMARTFATPCTDDYRREVLAGRVPPPPPHAISRNQVHCYAAAIDCLLAEIALPAYDNYQGRLVDHAAKLRLLLAAQSAVGVDADAAALEIAAASPGYEVTADSTARTLTLRQRFLPGQSDPLFTVRF
jgi:hypothetical protein